ncbi:DsrE/DsrF/DrsH-like family protein [Thalassobacillus devorans]|uniref:DsrE/DsrF/DrsH-like family protein n=1 Tax=Thalassobacillus devorans TaxID=279813 RepID=UPI00048AA53B|nr:DsrE/DsrF/DrsH-like family protein [Thalassobacillus devorans]
MNAKKVVILALHDEMESAYPPLNVAAGAAASGAEVTLAFSRKGVNILQKEYVPVPSEGMEYLSHALEDFKAASIHELLEIAVETGVQLYAVDLDMEVDADFIYPAEQVPIKWVLNEGASADLFLHF